ncbi:hypothetical protein [Cronobacter dublinensis]|uniref:hypothetical protein n=1 Tax=Cronobacter dublinensis TaxID=413497 RepID=UPI000CFD8207|nr:hypothetical protein [Cronobacter dublinensis]
MITISNERLESLQRQFKEEGFNDIRDSEVMQLVEENLALRKERERAVPVAWLAAYHGEVCDDITGRTRSALDAYADKYGWEPALTEITPLYTAPPAPSADDDSLPYDPQIAEYEQMMEAEQAQADTTSQQFESLAGKAVGGSDGFECTPVADLYELLTKCGECYDYTTSAKVAADWIKDGYSAREYVKLDRLQEALVFAAPEPCK